MTVVWNSEHLSRHFLKDFGSCVQMTACRSLAVEMGQEGSIGSHWLFKNNTKCRFGAEPSPWDLEQDCGDVIGSSFIMPFLVYSYICPSH